MTFHYMIMFLKYNDLVHYIGFGDICPYSATTIATELASLICIHLPKLW